MPGPRQSRKRMQASPATSLAVQVTAEPPSLLQRLLVLLLVPVSCPLAHCGAALDALKHLNRAQFFLGIRKQHVISISAHHCRNKQLKWSRWHFLQQLHLLPSCWHFLLLCCSCICCHLDFQESALRMVVREFMQGRRYQGSRTGRSSDEFESGGPRWQLLMYR